MVRFRLACDPAHGASSTYALHLNTGRTHESPPSNGPLTTRPIFLVVFPSRRRGPVTAIRVSDQRQRSAAGISGRNQRSASRAPCNFWRSPGRAGHGFVAAMNSRPRYTSTKRGPGAWLSFRRETVPGTAPIAFLETQTRLSTPRGRPPASHRRGRSDAGPPLADQKAGAPGRLSGPPPTSRQPFAHSLLRGLCAFASLRLCVHPAMGAMSAMSSVSIRVICGLPAMV